MNDLVAKLDIKEKLYKYCHAIDKMDAEAAKEIFRIGATG